MEALASGYADTIRREIGNLIDAGCRAIQIDDPVLLRYPEQARDWGIEVLQRCFSGYEKKATWFVHICRGYPDKTNEQKGIEYKANQDSYSQILEWLSTSHIDVISIEGAQGDLDLSVLPAAGEKTVMLGVLDVGNNDVEGVSDLVQRGTEALRYVPKERLILAPDCGMFQLSRRSARRKLANMAKAASILNQS
jgi:5-methyltetrahydropteroyltriglutamate--homocysteine methyltransferase